MGVIENRGGRVYLCPPYFLPEKDKKTPILNLCLGYGHENSWRIPNYVPELAPVCSPEQYKAFSIDLADVLKQNEMSTFWEYFGCYCCLCTLGLSCLPSYCFKDGVRTKLQEVCNRHSKAWGQREGTLTIELVSSNSSGPAREVGLMSIPVDEAGTPMLDNPAQRNVISPELLRARIAMKHASVYGTSASINGIPVYCDHQLGIAPGEHLNMQKELEIIDMVDQDFVPWPPLGFSVRIRLTDPLLFQLWPRRVDKARMDPRWAGQAAGDTGMQIAPQLQQQIAGYVQQILPH